MTYEPQPGTIPHRAIAWLRAMRKHHPSTEWWCTLVIVEALSVEGYGFTAYMRPARERGIVHTKKHPDNVRLLMWKLGDGTPDPGLGYRVPAQADEEPGPLESLPEPVTAALPPPKFRALMWEGQLLATGMKLVKGVAVFTPEQINEVKRVVTWARAA